MDTTDSFKVTARTRLRRRPARAAYDRATVYAILDEALICHVGFSVDAQPYVIPTIHARVGDQLYMHGAAASRMMRALGEGIPACVTVTLLDSLVLARSAFHHSMNYRSVVVLGTATTVTDHAERLAALEAIVEHVVPRRWREVRPPNAKELRATAVLRLPLREVSAKVRTGPPIDDADDLALDVWAGVLPLRTVVGPPVADPLLAAGITLPDSVRCYRR